VVIRPINRNSPIPLYYQLQEILKEEIEHGRWKTGDVIPSEAQLTAFYGVSRTVIRKALDILEGDGQVYRVKGKGTMIARRKFMYEAVAHSESQSKIGAQVPPQLAKLIEIRRVPVGGHVGRLLGLDPSHEVFEFAVAHSIHGSPISLGQIFIRTDASKALARIADQGLSPELQEGGPEALVQLSDRYGLRVTESRLTVEATVANEFESEILRIAVKTPVFLLTSVDYLSNGRPIGFTRTVVRSDYFQFSVVVRRAKGSSGGILESKAR
jgi:GntR family transcriptional regulator